MKKLGLVLGVASIAWLTTPTVSNAQTTAKVATKPAPTIEERAEKQTMKAVKELGLNDEQKAQFKKFALDRLYKVQPINEKIQSTSDEKEKASLRTQRKQINEEFFNNVNGILTPAQQEIWKKKKEEMINKHKEAHKH